MVSSINGNIAAGLAQSNIGSASTRAASSIARLSSGDRIVQSSDDVAGLSVGTSLRTQVTTLRTALTNASQGNSLLQVADGALSQIVDILQRQKAIAVQAGSGSIGDTERSYLNQEFQGLASQIDQITGSTNFNGVKLLNGSLGSTTVLAKDVTAAGSYDPTSVTLSDALTAVISTNPIEAFDNTGATLSDYTAGTGHVDITDPAGTALTGTYDSVNSALIGKFSNFKFSNVIYGAGAAGSATLTVSINGVDFTGNAAGAGTDVTLHNGNTYIRVGTGTLAFDDSATTENTQLTLSNDFRNTSFQRTTTIQGVNFDGTRLAGAVGSTTFGVASARLSSTNANISGFAYVSNAGSADSNTLSVQVNGKTFTATNVLDTIADGTLGFASDDGQSIVIDVTGITGSDGDDITNIRLNQADRAGFINALNQGFSRSGGGLNFALGSSASDSIQVSLQSASTYNLYGGSALDVASASTAAASSVAIDKALQTVTSIRATVGALQSRFNFTSANLESSIQNQDAARSSLLDTDVSTESTAYATAQVQLQAGIAVLAQANQLPQNLLKLIQ